MKQHVFTFILGALLASPAVAQDPVIWSGGVGIGERAEAPEEGTRLEFFAPTGAFLANVEVTITDDQDREVVDTSVNGPWLILDLPEGQYQVEATTDRRERASARIDTDAQQRSFGIMLEG